MWPSSAAFPRPLVEREIRNGAAGLEPVPIWDAGVTGGFFFFFTSCTTVMTLVSFLEEMFSELTCEGSFQSSWTMHIMKKMCTDFKASCSKI